jgi:hypothetical protein
VFSMQQTVGIGLVGATEGGRTAVLAKRDRGASGDPAGEPPHGAADRAGGRRVRALDALETGVAAGERPALKVVR